MKHRIFLIAWLLCIVASAGAKKPGDYVPKPLVWTTQSRNSSESMPCGGCDMGMNVWVEGGDLLFYISQSGWFDENNTLLKAGRWRLHFDGNPFGTSDFRQTLSLDEGCIYVEGGGVRVRLWVDVEQPVVFVAFSTRQSRHGATLSYESWRYRDRPLTKAECQQSSYKWVLPEGTVTRADSIVADKNELSFFHHNRTETVFDFTVQRENLQTVSSEIHNPLAGRLMGGTMYAPGFHFSGTTDGIYVGTDYRAWHFASDNSRNSTLMIDLRYLRHKEYQLTAVDGCGTIGPFVFQNIKASESLCRSARWWHDYWQRSWIQTDSHDPALLAVLRNYELMRFMLGCNARGQWPTKFNGGLFTFDPVYADSLAPFTPDYRKWGGGTMTAQNQRLVHWPMLKSGDTDLLTAQLDTYLRLLPTAELWTRHHWGHRGACFSEQIENFGLPNPAEYGKHKDGDDWGMERNAWLEYEWDTALEFCLMALQAHEYSGLDIRKYEPLIESCLRFFDEHYQYLARRRGAKSLDGDGHLIIFPGSGCETYKQAYNPASTIAALRTVATAFSRYLVQSSHRAEHLAAQKDSSLYADSLLQRLPDIPLRTIDGDTCIAPAAVWARIQNVETPQLYPVFPWRIYGMGRPGLDIARNTYLKDPHAVEMRSTKGWKQDNIWAACLGLTDEARRLITDKLADGPYRFPAFWDPGFDWAPDLNRGGAAMIGLQEMLLQESPDGTPILFPAWPREWNVSFRLRATGGRVVEATMNGGRITSESIPKQ